MGARIALCAAEVMVGWSRDSGIRQTWVYIQTHYVLVMCYLANHSSSLTLSIPTCERG